MYVELTIMEYRLIVKLILGETISDLDKEHLQETVLPLIKRNFPPKIPKA